MEIYKYSSDLHGKRRLWGVLWFVVLVGAVWYSITSENYYWLIFIGIPAGFLSLIHILSSIRTPAFLKINDIGIKASNWPRMLSWDEIGQAKIEATEIVLKRLFSQVETVLTSLVLYSKEKPTESIGRVDSWNDFENLDEIEKIITEKLRQPIVSERTEVVRKML